jgi:methyltransferase
VPPSASIAALTIIAVLLVMAGEAVLSAFNERVLRARGAVEPPGDVHDIMRFAYPLSFVAMGIEGAVWGPVNADRLAIGFAVFGLAKALKIWAISTLGVRWTFRVLIVPGAPLVQRGPYAILRHPNYVAVVGELVGVALIVGALVTGALAVVGFGTLLRRRIAVEDRALGRQ